MVKAEFSIIGTTHKCEIHEEKERFYVSIDDDFKGFLTKDLKAKLDFKTDDKELELYIRAISDHFKESEYKSKLSAKINELWGQNIIKTELTDNENLLLVEVHPDTDLDEFGQVFEDIILEYVQFLEHLEVLITKENDDYAVIVTIN